MDRPFTLLGRRVARRSGGVVVFRLANAVAAMAGAANRLVIALRRSRMRQERYAIELAIQHLRTSVEVLRK